MALPAVGSGCALRGCLGGWRGRGGVCLFLSVYGPLNTWMAGLWAGSCCSGMGDYGGGRGRLGQVYRLRNVIAAELLVCAYGTLRSLPGSEADPRYSLIVEGFLVV